MYRARRQVKREGDRDGEFKALVLGLNFEPFPLLRDSSRKPECKNHSRAAKEKEKECSRNTKFDVKEGCGVSGLSCAGERE